MYVIKQKRKSILETFFFNLKNPFTPTSDVKLNSDVKQQQKQ